MQGLRLFGTGFAFTVFGHCRLASVDKTDVKLGDGCFCALDTFWAKIAAFFDLNGQRDLDRRRGGRRGRPLMPCSNK
jgi:hypothetical protein